MARTFAHGQPHGPKVGPASLRQAQALGVIRSYWRAFKQSPTRAELGEALGISKVSAHLLVKKLARDGLVTIQPGQHRNVMLTKPAKGQRTGENHG